MNRRESKPKARRTKKKKIKNHLWRYRDRVGYSQKEVAKLLGYKNSARISDHERGIWMPNLKTALKLEIIYRIPVAALYKDLYSQFKEEIRKVEEKLKYKNSKKYE